MCVLLINRHFEKKSIKQLSTNLLHVIHVNHRENTAPHFSHTQTNTHLSVLKNSNRKKIIFTLRHFYCGHGELEPSVTDSVSAQSAE